MLIKDNMNMEKYLGNSTIMRTQLEVCILFSSISACLFTNTSMFQESWIQQRLQFGQAVQDKETEAVWLGMFLVINPTV